MTAPILGIPADATSPRTALVPPVALATLGGPLLCGAAWTGRKGV